MPRSESRATISSLKATKTAHRMANEILNPHIEVPKPVESLLPPEPSRATELQPLHLSLPPIDWQRPSIELIDYNDEPDPEEANISTPTPRRIKLTLNQRIDQLAERWLAVAAVVLALAVTIAALIYVATHP